MSPSVLLSSLSLPTSTYHLFRYLCIFSLSIYPSVICLSIHLQQSACSGFAILGARFIRGLGSPGEKKKKKIQPSRNPQIQEFQPLYPQDLGTPHGPIAPGMAGTLCLFSERFCPRAPFLTPLRPPVRFLDSTNEQNLPQGAENPRGTLGLSTLSWRKGA